MIAAALNQRAGSETSPSAPRPTGTATFALVMARVRGLQVGLEAYVAIYRAQDEPMTHFRVRAIGGKRGSWDRAEK